jgi:hypothetical protein
MERGDCASSLHFNAFLANASDTVAGGTEPLFDRE